MRTHWQSRSMPYYALMLYLTQYRCCTKVGILGREACPWRGLLRGTVVLDTPCRCLEQSC